MTMPTLDRAQIHSRALEALGLLYLAQNVIPKNRLHYYLELQRILHELFAGTPEGGAVQKAASEATDLVWGSFDDSTREPLPDDERYAMLIISMIAEATRAPKAA